MLFSEEAPKPLQEAIVEASGQLVFEGKPFDYRAQAGTLVLKDDQGKDKVSIFYTGYFSLGTPSKERPITFCFNGGPGAGSVWLNLGFAGPKRISGGDLLFLDPPYTLENNPLSLLDKSDLVFIDPPSAGLSVAASGTDPKKLYSVEEDALLMAEFIKLFTIKSKRWDSPKYLIGESYGGLRAALVAHRLHDEDGYYLNGMMLVSPALDMQTISFNEGNDLPYILYVPSYAETARYHQVVETDPSDALQFAFGPYSTALLAGDLLDPKVKEQVASRLSQLIGLSKEVILDNNLRIHPARFRHSLLGTSYLLGRFDARSKGLSLNGQELYPDYDPSFDAVFGAATAAFNQYLDKELKWPALREYRPLVTLPSWDWGKGNHFANALNELKRLLIQNPKLKLLVAAGSYDLATPFAATDYALNHLGLPAEVRSRIHTQRFPAGHMFYFNPALFVDIKSFSLLLYE